MWVAHPNTQAAKQAGLACTAKATPSEGETRKSVEVPWTLKLYLTAGGRVSACSGEDSRHLKTIHSMSGRAWTFIPAKLGMFEGGM